MRRVFLVLLVLLALTLLAGCRRPAPEGPEGEVWFVHATDPHLYYGDGDRKTQQRQEPMNQAAFSDLIGSLDQLPGNESRAGVPRRQRRFRPRPVRQRLEEAAGGDSGPGRPDSPTATATPTPTPPVSPGVDSGVKLVVDALRKSPVKNIYLVPGNNDVEDEAPNGLPVAATQLFWDRVRDGLRDTGVTVRDLTSCYFGGERPSDCYVDVGPSYRLIGFPSQSFKDGLDASRAKVQIEQLDRLAGLVLKAGQDGKRVLIVTHIPEIDDPHRLAENSMKADPDKSKWAPGRPDWSEASPWNVPKEVYDKWKEIVDSRPVAGVLAGHFHDSHKEIYRPPYPWSTASPDEPARTSSSWRRRCPCGTRTSRRSRPGASRCST